MTATVEKIRSILASQLDIDEDKIDENTDIADDLGADSLDVVELMMAVEEEFSVTIEEDEVRKFKTVGDVGRYIDEQA